MKREQKITKRKDRAKKRKLKKLEELKLIRSFVSIYGLSFSREELVQYESILSGLASEISVVIDFGKGQSEQSYRESKEVFLSKDRSIGEFTVSIQDRGNSPSPLVTINNPWLKFNDSFDVSWARCRAIVCQEALKK